MKKILGIFRGFPGLGRVVSGISLLETLKKNHHCDVEIITYLQGKEYLASKGLQGGYAIFPADYCSIGLLPTNKMGAIIHSKVKLYNPDLVVIDGEPLILHSLRISYPSLKIVALLNPSDVDNPQNDKEAMDYFNTMYRLSDLAIIHGLRTVEPLYKYNKYISIRTILRTEILSIRHKPSNNIYCVLGGGTVNAEQVFVDSTVQIGELCKAAAEYLPEYNMHIICSSQNIYNAIRCGEDNVSIHHEIMNATDFYSDACLVITRSGRNTLSELAYLGIPTISFISGCLYRQEEQKQNMEEMASHVILHANISDNPFDFALACRSAIGKEHTYSHFVPGNDIAINSILDLIDS